MRNLKRALSLVLAAMMLIGMMVVGASAASKDFTDKGEIKHTEAVNTMVALNVISGKEDGSYFDPTGTLTRAEMAKIISYVMNGGVEPVLGTKVVPTYSDIKGHWAEAYIEYCTSMGIINGDGAGKFNPEGTLTGTQAAKMFLTAMGYNANVFGFTGDSWATNTDRYANEAGLYEELGGLKPSAPISRDDAAQMAYNAIQATMMRRTWSQDMTTGQLTETYSPWVESGIRHNLLGEKFGAKMTYGQLTDVDGKTITIDPDYNYSEKVTGNIASDTSFTKIAEDYSALLGQTVKVIYKSSSQVIGVSAMGENVVYDTSLSAVTADGAKVEFSDASYGLSLDDKNQAAITATADQIAVLKVDVAGNVTSLGAKTSAYFNFPVSYDSVKFIDNDNDGKLEYAVITEMVPAKVNYISNTEIIAGATSYKVADNNVATGLAKNDYVVVSGNAYDECVDINKVEMITGKVDGYKTANAGSDHQYLVGGTWYIADTKQTADAGDDMELIAVNGVIFYSDKLAGSSNLDGVVLVTDVDNTGSNVVINAAIVKADGTKAVVKADTISTGAVAPVAGGLYTYTETANGYKFKAVTADIGDYKWTAGSASDVTGTTKIENIASTGIADDAVIFIWNGAKDGKVITGKQLKNEAIANYNTQSLGSFIGTANGLDRVVMAAVKYGTVALPTVGDVANNYGLVVSNSYKMDSDYITYQVWNGSEIVTVKEKDTTVSRAQMDVIAYSAIDANGEIKDVATGVATNAYVNGLSTDGKNVWLNGQSDSANKYEINADTVIMYYDSTTDKAEEIGKAGGELKLADKIGDSYIQNVKFVDADADKKLDFLLVEVKNNIGTTYTLPTPTGSTLFNLTAVTTGAQKGGNTITYLLEAKANNNAATQVRVTLTDANSGTQVVYVTVPAGTATTKGSIQVSFRQPADSTSTVKADDVVTYSAISSWAGSVNGITSATGAVAAGTYYEGDTVTITVTTGQAATGAATVTLTGTDTGLTAVSPVTGGNVTNNGASGTFTLAAGAAAQTFTFTVTATAGENAPVISIA